MVHPTERPLRLADVAKRTAFSEPVIRKMVKRGELPHCRVGRRILFVSSELAAKLGPVFRGGA